MRWEEQEAAFDRHIEAGFNYARTRMAAKRPQLLELARQRFSDGYYEYGDGSFEKDADTLDQELDEELADAVVYAMIQVYKWYTGGEV